MYRILHDNGDDRGLAKFYNPDDQPFIKVPLTLEEQEMSRMTFDGLLLQSHLPEGETLSISEIAATMFCREGEPVGKIAIGRAKQAALNLVALGNARAVPNRREMTHVLSCASPGTQLSAIMSLSIRRSVQNRRESDKLVTQLDGNDVLDEIVASLPAIIQN